MKKLNETLAAFGLALADLLEHPDCPPEIHDHLSQLVCDLDNAAGDILGRKRQAVFARVSLPALLAALPEHGDYFSDLETIQ